MPRAKEFGVRSALYRLVLIIPLFVPLELSKISRGYDITLKKYQDLLAKSLESELAENMEKKQKGEQFQILDPANFPVKPIRPNRLIDYFDGILWQVWPEALGWLFFGITWTLLLGGVRKSIHMSMCHYSRRFLLW